MHLTLRTLVRKFSSVVFILLNLNTRLKNILVTTLIPFGISLRVQIMTVEKVEVRTKLTIMSRMSA